MSSSAGTQGPVAPSIRLQAAVEAVRVALADDSRLLPELAADAVLARADGGELVAATPRLMELLVAGELSVDHGVAATSRLGRHRWSRRERALVEEALDAWWLQTLKRQPEELPGPWTAGVTLGVLDAYGAPSIRWLGPWLAELDGPGARHLADVIVGSPEALGGPAWAGREDRAAQVLGWARTETVVNGLTLIGGLHLSPEVLDEVLDRLLS